MMIFSQMKKFLRNLDKHKNEQNSKLNEKTLSKLTTMRGILKDGRCGPECTGDSMHEPEEFTARESTLKQYYTYRISIPAYTLEQQ
jgi:hypothetical protein